MPEVHENRVLDPFFNFGKEVSRPLLWGIPMLALGYAIGAAFREMHGFDFDFKGFEYSKFEADFLDSKWLTPTVEHLAYAFVIGSAGRSGFKLITGQGGGNHGHH